MKKKMGSETSSDTVLARSLLAKIAQCPETGGRPTAMTRKQFEAACAFHQERNRTRCRNAPFAVRVPVEHNGCALCQGKVRPRELRLVSLSRLKHAMAKGVTLCP